MKRKISLALLLLLSACNRSKTGEELVLIQIQDRNGLSETISNPDRIVTFSKIDFLSAQPFKKVLRVYRNEGQNRSVVTTYHPNGTPWQLLEAKDMRAFGSYCEWFPSGAKKIEARVIGGSADLCAGAQESWLFDGEARVWNEDGKLIGDIFYDKGVLSGVSRYFYPSGALEKEAPYGQDRLEGEVREFWEEGPIKSKTPYRNGQKDGISLAFWPDGSLCAKEEYEMGLLKKGHYWGMNQELMSEVENGTGMQPVFAGLRLAQMQEIRKGAVEGIVKTFDAAGNLHSVFYLKNGKKHGLETEYFPVAENGASLPKLSINWDQNMMQGLVKTWYDNEELQSQREMCRNSRNGMACSWYRDGSLMLTEEYENDHLVSGKYYRKGQPNPESSVTNGTGVATLFDENGVFLRKVSYLKGAIADE